MASLFRSSPQRPTVQIPQTREPDPEGEETINDEEETVSFTDVDGFKLNQQIESVTNKLGIERRVQYGAEKMLDVSYLLHLHDDSAKS